METLGKTLGKSDHAFLKRTFVFASPRSQGVELIGDCCNLWFAPWFSPQAMLTLTFALRMGSIGPTSALFSGWGSRGLPYCLKNYTLPQIYLCTVRVSSEEAESHTAETGG